MTLCLARHKQDDLHVAAGPTDAREALRRGDAILVFGYDADRRERCLLATDAATVTADAVNAMACFGRGIIACGAGGRPANMCCAI